jgi:signal peptidase
VTTAGRWLVRLLFCALAAVLAAVLTVLVIVPRLTHSTALTVLTGSMRPAIPAGSVVIERKVDPTALRVGDIATYQQTPRRAVYITHRIKAIDTTTTPMLLTFKGDANDVVDPMPVPVTAVRGKVWVEVPYVGRLRQVFAGGGLRTVALILGVLGLGVYSVSQIVAGLRDRKRRVTA